MISKIVDVRTRIQSQRSVTNEDGVAHHGAEHDDGNEVPHELEGVVAHGRLAEGSRVHYVIQELCTGA